MKTLTQNEVTARLRALRRAVILFHVRPDGDCVGSAFALRRTLELCGADVWCVCAHRVPPRLAFLAGDQPGVLPSDLPNRFAGAPVITVDTASPGQMGDAAAAFLPRVELMIDHHGTGEPYADHYICPEASSTGEVLLPILRDLLGDRPMDGAVSSRLFAAISSDTGCFKFSNATAAAHRAAAELMEAGMEIPADEVNRLLFDCKTAAVLTAEKIALSNLQVFCEGRVAVTAITAAERSAAGLLAEDTDTMIDTIRVLDGVEISATLKEQEPRPGEPHLWRCSLRSTGADVAAIAAKFGGGGHRRAAGCSVEADSVEEATKQLLQGLCPCDLA